MNTTCLRCHVRGPVRLAPGDVCATCKAQQAWEAHEGKPLVIDRPAIEEAEQRRAGEAAGEPAWKRARVLVPPVVAGGAAVAAAVHVVGLFQRRPIGPLEPLLASMRRHGWGAAGFGFLALVVGIVALLLLRRSRHFRRLSLIGAYLSSVVIGGGAMTLGLLGGVFSGPQGWSHVAMPARAAAGELPAATDRIMRATVVLLAPDAAGDAKGTAVGTGSIVAREQRRAWVLTCSHVAMPYVAVGAFRDPARAHPVWVELSDGRGVHGKVRWTAPPPIDVALVEIEIDDPPEPVPIADASDAMVAGSPVKFVPNPMRTGWRVHEGVVLRRESHSTPAGEYSLLFSDLPVLPGDSGSGLFDAAGRLVGLNTWRKEDAGGAEGISLPAETLRKLVDDLRDGRLDEVGLEVQGSN